MSVTSLFPAAWYDGWLRTLVHFMWRGTILVTFSLVGAVGQKGSAVADIELSTVVLPDDGALIIQTSAKPESSDVKEKIDERTINRAKQAFRRPPGNTRIGAAKILYPLIKVGMPRTDVLNLLGAPDAAKAGQLRRFLNYSIAAGCEIEVEFDSETERVVRQHETGLRLDLPPSQVQPIPDDRKPFLSDYLVRATADAAGTTLRAGFVPYKPVVVWGEPLELTFTVENVGTSDFTFMFGGDYRGKGRHDRFKITITDTIGQELPDPRADAPNFGGMMSHDIVTPGGLPFRRQIDLTHFRVVEKPGIYTVSCSFAFDPPHQRLDGPAKPVVKSSFRLTILERTPERVAKILDEYVRNAESAPDDKLAVAMELVARFGREDSVPRLVQLAGRGSVQRRATVYSALPLVPGDASLDVALVGLADNEPTIRMAAAVALGRMRRPRGVDALLSALSNEQSPVKESILVALGTSQSERALPVLVSALEGSKPELQSAAVQACVAFGGEEAAAVLLKHVENQDLSFRYQVVRGLTDQLRQPLNTDWLLPVLMSREQNSDWFDSMRLVRLYGGDRSASVLLSCLDFDVPWSHRNWWILHYVSACPNAPKFEYPYDPNSDGTAELWEQNRQTLNELRDRAGPIPPVALSKKDRAPYLVTNPPIDFKPAFTLTESGVEVTSGFYRVVMNRGGFSSSYRPSVEWSSLYHVRHEVRQLLDSPEETRARGITPERAKALRAIPMPADLPSLDIHATAYYRAWRESPVGPIQQQTAEDFGELFRIASQDYHAAVVAFAEAARKVVPTPD